MNIVIRSNCNDSLGHLSRCRHLSSVLESIGYTTHYLLDHIPEYDIAWVSELSYSAVYRDDEVFDSEIVDAERCTELLVDLKPAMIIVDDYRLAQSWEQGVGSAECTVMAIDDLRRTHSVDVLLEPKFTDAIDERIHAETCLLLEGPHYTLLDPAYAYVSRKSNYHEFSIVMSLGGGGDLQMLQACGDAILTAYKQNPPAFGKQGLLIKPVIGPLATNSHLIREWADQNPEYVVPIEKAENLLDHFRQADLFIGAAGTSVYETAVCKLPAVTFSTSGNQVSVLNDLEALGHFFHVNEFASTDVHHLGRLVTTLIMQYSRCLKLRDHAVHTIDGHGVQRVASIIHERLVADHESATLLRDSFNESIYGPIAARGNALSEVEDNSGVLTFRECNDSDINSYLTARNLATNRGNMTTDQQIPSLAHYRWWFNTQRHSYSVEKCGRASLYIWHELVRSNGQDVLVGGWFVTGDNTDIACVMSALHWQLELTDAAFPGVPWIAVIKKTNHFVLKMNERAGFRQALKDSDSYSAIQQYFPTADSDEFCFVYREGVNIIERCPERKAVGAWVG